MFVSTKTIYVCQSCGSEEPRWFGRCPACEAWNSLVEEVRKKEPRRPSRASGAAAPAPAGAPADLGLMNASPLGRIETGLGEFDRVLGGGIVPGEVALLGGDPGIGKSTLLLQVAASLVAGAVPMPASQTPSSLSGSA